MPAPFQRAAPSRVPAIAGPRHAPPPEQTLYFRRHRRPPTLFYVPLPAQQLVLRHIHGDSVDPGGKRRGGIELVEVAEHADKDFLGQMFSAAAIANRAMQESE